MGFIDIKVLPTAEAIKIANFIVEEIILKLGALREMVSDRGRLLLSKIVKDINLLFQTYHLPTIAYHPQTIDFTEKFNRTLACMLQRHMIIKQRNWDVILPFVTFVYNSTKEV
ncbi:transposon Ty3-I Gag-Pol polyprotein [Nephila pilipes]|uniref:Transposon Ty3-I Gag-Pol polyprotein n=1 Tax=Nephila pilipes TaxID=299642 RepID=A0A8X6I6V9_NEPPI|nr:transposon Ty3-I Gag-Pol polyprotein [Nephila pilipes]